jgi:O-methyltransferase involved in polyketide biosynthesis
MSEPKFTLGRTVVTANAASVLTYDDMAAGLLRHITGDWGDLDAEDRQENDRALKVGCRLLSAYRSACGIRFWIITEASREVSTILLPEDY